MTELLSQTSESTDHETLEAKVIRVQGEAWREYAWRTKPADDERNKLCARHEAAQTTAWVFADGRFYEISRHEREPSMIAAVDTLREGYLRLREDFGAFRQFNVRATDVPNAMAGCRWLVIGKKAPEPSESEWTDEKNDRRCYLVDKEIDGTLEPSEKTELEDLQNQMLAYRRKVAPLPLDDLRQLHQELLRKAHEAQED